jgi:hypothetical protein
MLLVNLLAYFDDCETSPDKRQKYFNEHLYRINNDEYQFEEIYFIISN